MDFMVMPDTKQKMHMILVIVDVASDFVVCRYVCPGENPLHWRHGWLSKNAGLDGQGRPNSEYCWTRTRPFARTSMGLLSDLGVPLINAAAEAHRQTGKVESKIRVLKEMSTKVFAENDVEGSTTVRIAVGRMAAANNALDQGKF